MKTRNKRTRKKENRYNDGFSSFRIECLFLWGFIPFHAIVLLNSVFLGIYTYFIFVASFASVKATTTEIHLSTLFEIYMHTLWGIVNGQETTTNTKTKATQNDSFFARQASILCVCVCLFYLILSRSLTWCFHFAQGWNLMKFLL